MESQNNNTQPESVSVERDAKGDDKRKNAARNVAVAGAAAIAGGAATMAAQAAMTDNEEAEPEVIAIEEPEIPVRQTSGRVNEEHEVKSEKEEDDDFNVDDIRIEVGVSDDDSKYIIETETGEIQIIPDPTTGEYVVVDIDEIIIDDDFIINPAPTPLDGEPDITIPDPDSDEDVWEDYIV